MSRKLADRDIEQILAALENGNISEDSLEDESEDEETFYTNAREKIRELEDEDAEDHEDPNYSDPPLVQDFPGPSSQSIASLSTQEGHEHFVEFDKRKLIWKKDSLLYDESRKWYLRLFYHLLDLTVINSWVLIKQNLIAKDVSKKQLPNLGEFRNCLADTLCNIGKSSGSKRGRPSTSSLERELHIKKQKGPQHPLPSKDLRVDGFEHLPVFANRLRCKMPNCKGTTQWSCTKCNVPLCLNQRNNCFKDFHTL